MIFRLRSYDIYYDIWSNIWTEDAEVVMQNIFYIILDVFHSKSTIFLYS